MTDTSMGLPQAVADLLPVPARILFNQAAFFGDGAGGGPLHGDGLSDLKLLDKIDQGFCIVEVLFDDNEKPLDYRFVELNAAFEEQTGVLDARGRTMREIEPELEDHWFATLGGIALSGEPARFQLPADKLGRHFDVYAFRVGPAHLHQVGCLFSDISARKRQEERRELIAAEVEHRAKNLFSLVSSMIRLTNADTVAEYKATLEGRMNALARSHQLISGVEGADLGELVSQEMAFFHAGGKVSWEGPPVRLPSHAAQQLALALHELATNAAKYGALSVGSGRLTVSWELGDGELKLLWAEAGGPAVEQAPARKGVGTAVISGAIESQLGGRVTYSWQTEGLRCSIALPLEALAE